MERVRWRSFAYEAEAPSRKQKKQRLCGECRANWCGPTELPGRCRCPRYRKSFKHWCLLMPLVRKSADQLPGPKPDASKVLQLLASSSTDERWAAARAAADVVGGVSAIAAALPREHDSRVREAMFTSLARHATAESIDAIAGLLRSNNANLRTGALDTLRILAG